MKNDCDALNLVKKQFLCAYPLQKINVLVYAEENEQFQRDLIDNTTRLDLVINYPIKISYQRAFIKSIIQKLEQQGSVIVDEIFDEYGRLLALFEQECFKHYIFGGKILTLKENPCLVTEGTTGLRTWQASLALSEWILKNSQRFEGKTILELGSGIGLCGLATVLSCNIKAFLFSDYHASVLSKLCDNIQLNHKNICNLERDECLAKFCGITSDNKVLKVLDLDWAKVDKRFCEKIGKIDKIVAADVVYDEDLFLWLIDAVDCLFNCCQVEEFILSCTERNQSTLGKFLNLAGKKFKINEKDIPEQDNFLWENEAPIRLFILKQK